VVPHSLYRSPKIARMIKSRRLIRTGYVAKMEEGRRAFKILSGTLRGKRSLGMPRLRWEDNIRINLKERGINLKDWDYLSQVMGLLAIPCECIIELPDPLATELVLLPSMSESGATNIINK
jgi:hypothetical protein